MIRAGFTYVAQGTSWMVVAVADGICTVVPNDPLRSGTFDGEFDVTRVPIERLASRLAAAV